MSWDTVHDSRRTFLACLRAQCSPGTRVEGVPAPGLSEDGRLDTAAAVLLSLLDPGLTLALDGPGAGHLEALYRLTGAAPASVAAADFVLVSGDPTAAFQAARRSDRRRPEHSATVVTIASGALPVILTGPGIETELSTDLALPASAVRAFAAANASPPAGLDVLVAGAGTVTALPRSSRIRMEAA